MYNRIDISNIDYKNFDYTYEIFRDESQVQTWIEAGHNLKNTKIGINQKLDIKEFTTVLNHFDHLTHIGIAFHVLQPGNYLPEHKDKYNFYAKKYNINDINQIERTVIFLDDSRPGHFLTVGRTVYSSWSAGDSVSWKGDTPHSAINLGLVPRYTMQITGILC